MPDKPQIIIHVEGGCVQEVLSTVPVDWWLIDYDTEGADLEELYAIPQGDGSFSEAVAGGNEASVMPERVQEIINAKKAYP